MQKLRLVAFVAFIFIAASCALFIASSATDVMLTTKDSSATFRAGLYRFCIQPTGQSETCDTTDIDCKYHVVTDSYTVEGSVDKCHEINAARAFAIIACVFSAVSAIFAIVNVIKGGTLRFVRGTTSAFSFLAAASGIVAFALITDITNENQDPTAGSTTQRDYSYSLWTAGMCTAVVGFVTFFVASLQGQKQERDERHNSNW